MCAYIFGGSIALSTPGQQMRGPTELSSLPARLHFYTRTLTSAQTLTH